MTDESGAVGLVLARSARLLSTEPFYNKFMAGAEEKLAERRPVSYTHLTLPTIYSV